MALGDEVKYRTLVETAPDPIFLVDMETGTIREVNQRVETLLGYTRSELVGRSVRTLHPTENIDQYMRKFEQAVNQESIQFARFDDGTQVYLVASDGERIPVDITANVVEGQHGPVLFGIARDISELKRYENEIQQLAGELAVVNRIVRHDIRNDMAVILAWLEELKETLDDSHTETLTLLLRRAESVVELTDTVKDYVEMLEDDAEPQLEWVNVQDVVEAEVLAVQQAYDDVDITVTKVPNEPVLANSMLASVFRNLLHNAVQHNDKDEAIVRVTAEQHPDSIVVHVADNGPGIPESQLSDIFGKGQKSLDSSGTGIGLYLVGELVEMFDGTIRVADNDPDGTVFSVELRRPSATER